MNHDDDVIRDLLRMVAEAASVSQPAATPDTTWAAPAPPGAISSRSRHADAARQGLDRELARERIARQTQRSRPQHAQPEPPRNKGGRLKEPRTLEERWQERMERAHSRMQDHMDRAQERMQRHAQRWTGGSGPGGGRPSGNRAFDEYRAETLRRLVPTWT